MPGTGERMEMKKIKIRTRILKAFTAVLFFSFMLIGLIFNIAVRVFTTGDQPIYVEPLGAVGRSSFILFVVVGVMFVRRLLQPIFYQTLSHVRLKSWVSLPKASGTATLPLTTFSSESWSWRT